MLLGKLFQQRTKIINIEYVKRLFNYSKGNLYWHKRPREDFADFRSFVTWNSIYPGAIAGGLSDKRGYFCVHIDDKKYMLHRLIFFWHHGYFPHNVDHIDGNKSNNKIENLRSASGSQNQHNKGIQKNNTSGYKGVSWNSREGKWQSSIQANNKRKHLGYYNSPEEAYGVYCAAAEVLHKDFKRLK